MKRDVVTLLNLVAGVFVAAALCIGIVTAAEPTAPAAPAAGVQVGILNYKFDPETLTVPVGTTVTWVNHDEVPHSVMSSDKRFTSSGGLDTGESYSYTFTQAGTYGYYCSLHPFMTAKIVVVVAASKPAESRDFFVY